MPLSKIANNAIEASSQYTGFKNRLINGDMCIDQRNIGNAVTIDGSFPVDRFQVNIYGTGSAQRIAMSNPAEVAGFTHYVKLIRTSSGSNYSMFGQKIENVKLLSGKQMTLSFWIRGDVINASGWSVWNGAYKDDNTFIGYGPNNGTVFTITGTWTQVTMRMDAPIISVDPGANGGYFYVFLRCTGPTENFNISTTGWQLEVGNTATSFDYRPYGTELALCQRYYWKGTINAGGVFGGSGGSIPIIAWGYPVSMRSAPTFAWISGGNTSNGNASYSITGVVLANAYTDSAQILWSQSGSTGTNAQGAMTTAAVSSFAAEL